MLKLFGAYYYAQCKKLECSFSPLKTYFRISAESPGHCGGVSSVAWARKWEYLRTCESACLACTDSVDRTRVTPSSTRRCGMLYLCISVGNIEKESRRKAVSCNEELFPREREDKRVHTLLTQRVTFVFRIIYVKSHSSGFGPQRVNL